MATDRRAVTGCEQPLKGDEEAVRLGGERGEASHPMSVGPTPAPPACEQPLKEEQT